MIQEKFVNELTNNLLEEFPNLHCYFETKDTYYSKQNIGKIFIKDVEKLKEELSEEFQKHVIEDSVEIEIDVHLFNTSNVDNIEAVLDIGFYSQIEYKYIEILHWESGSFLREWRNTQEIATIIEDKIKKIFRKLKK